MTLTRTTEQIVSVIVVSLSDQCLWQLLFFFNEKKNVTNKFVLDFKEIPYRTRETITFRLRLQEAS